jgi:YfiH family protein
VEDDPGLVLANRRTFFNAYGLPLDRSVWCKQVHQNAVQVIDEQAVRPRAQDGGRGDRGALDEDSVVPDSDALITDLAGVPLCVTLADCVPILLYDATQHVLGLVHAGWSGTVSRICSTAVEAMAERYGTHAPELIAAIGPSISPQRYEVGTDVIAAATAAYGPETEQILTPASPGKALFDLWTANRLDLEGCGVPPARIEVAEISTIDNLTEFYSHRAEQRTGRFVAIAMLM